MVGILDSSEYHLLQNDFYLLNNFNQILVILSICLVVFNWAFVARVAINVANFLSKSALCMNSETADL